MPDVSFIRRCVLGFLLSFASVAWADEPQVIDSEFLLERGAWVDFVFEVEGRRGMAHASTLVETGNGDLLCAWFAGSGEGKRDVGIWMARYSDGQWGAMEEVAKVSEVAHWNPVLFRETRSGIHLFFKVGDKISTWRTFWMSSVDDGLSWSEARELVAGDVGGRGPVRNKPIVLADGSWLAGASTELDGWDSFFDRSEDFGVTWSRSEDVVLDRALLKGRGAIQPTLWEWKPGHVRALFRTTSGLLGRSDSTDSGRTWSEMVPSGLPNNNSGVDAVRVADGRVFLVYNPLGRWGGRRLLNVAVSYDDGESWVEVASLESQRWREFSYPAIVETEDGIAISYTWKRKGIRVWRIPLSTLEEL